MMHWKIRSWLCSFVIALFFSRTCIVIFPLILPECRGGGCEIYDLLGFLLWDWYNPLIACVLTAYMFSLNLLFVKKYTLAFSSIVGFGAGLGTIVLYPSDGTEKISEFLDFIGVPNSELGFWMTIATYLLLFGTIFFVMTGVHFLFLKIRERKYRVINPTCG